MSTFERIKNNLKYAYHRKRYDLAMAKMQKHVADPDNRKFKKYSQIALESLKVCVKTPLH